MAVHRGKKHDYLGMMLDYSEKGKVKFDMIKYVNNMIEEFPRKLKSTETAITPATEDLFGQSKCRAKLLSKKQAKELHTTVAKGLFVSKRA